MKTFYVVVMVPVQAETPQDAQDAGWERLIDPDGPPEGLVECVSEEAPVLPASLVA